MYFFLFIALLALLACIILLPEFFNTLALFRVPPQLRPKADRLVPVAVIALLVFASLFFTQLTASGHMKPLGSNFSGAPLLLVDFFLAGFGAAACVHPIWIMSKLVPNLKKVANAHGSDQHAVLSIKLVSKVFGIALLLEAAFLARPFLVGSF
jgi:hypothetical protein